MQTLRVRKAAAQQTEDPVSTWRKVRQAKECEVLSTKRDRTSTKTILNT